MLLIGFEPETLESNHIKKTYHVKSCYHHLERFEWLLKIFLQIRILKMNIVQIKLKFLVSESNCATNTARLALI